MSEVEAWADVLLRTARQRGCNDFEPEDATALAAELAKVIPANRYRLAWANARARADAWKRLAKGDL